MSIVADRSRNVQAESFPQSGREKVDDRELPKYEGPSLWPGPSGPLRLSEELQYLFKKAVRSVRSLIKNEASRERGQQTDAPHNSP